MELSLSSEAVSCTATQEFRNILWKPKVHYRVHKSSILSQINPVHTTPSYLSETHFNIILPPTSRSSFPSGFPTKILYAFLFALIRAICPAYLILFDLIILIALKRPFVLHFGGQSP
jgi:hypothetical protein